jgi:hypothetical protein
VIGAYIVDLFRIDRDLVSPGAFDIAVCTLIEALQAIPGGLAIKPALSESLRAQMVRPTLALSIRLLRDAHQRQLLLPTELQPHDGSLQLIESAAGGGLVRRNATPDLDPNRHRQLLEVLAEQSLVRAIHLPLVLDEGPVSSAPSAQRGAIPAPGPEDDHPVVGVIDGGVAKLASLAPWLAGSAAKWGPLIGMKSMERSSPDWSRGRTTSILRWRSFWKGPGSRYMTSICFRAGSSVARIIRITRRYLISWTNA